MAAPIEGLKSAGLPPIAACVLTACQISSCRRGQIEMPVAGG